MYNVINIDSSATIINTTEIQENLANFSGSAVVWYFDCIELVENDQLQDINLEEVIKLRAFNTNSELYIWRTNTILAARLRTDSTNDSGKNQVVDTETFIDPLVDSALDNNTKVLTRNYIEYYENGQAYYTDCRIVKLLK